MNVIAKLTTQLLILHNDNDNENENTLFDHNIQIEITIYKQFK